MSKKARFLALVAALLFGVALGCTTTPAPKTIDVAIDDVLAQSAITREITLAVGDTLKISLGSNRTTPYRWSEQATIGDRGALQQTGHQYLKPDTDRLGAPGVEVWTFKALKAGSTTIVLSYSSVVGGGTAPTCTFTARVTIT